MPRTDEPVARPIDEITNPLDQLRGAIRRFVLADGLLTAGLFVIAWFWLGLAVDFGLFKVSGFDWVLDAPRLLRAVALAALGVVFVGILVTRLWGRLAREYSYPALALVLEKRFPVLLDDRLITAVELADVRRAGTFGYSEDMVRQTISEARERVAEVPISDVFNWPRLRTKAILLGLTAVGTTLAVYAVYAAATGASSPRQFGGRFADVAAVWGERNLLLMHTPWPRRVHLELADFPGNELRIGKDAPPPKVRAKAYKWVIADRSREYGWRPLAWADMTEKLLGFPPPPAPPGATADQLEPDAAAKPDVKKIFDRLDVLVTRPAMTRTLRKLEIPKTVTLTYAGPKTSGSLSLTAEAGNEFSGEVGGLKESVRFVVRGEDFVSLPKTITLVPPPVLTKFTHAESQPAYLYHPPAVGQPFASLKGLKQQFAEKDLSLTGDKTTYAVRAGTDIALRGVSDKPLSRVALRPKIGKLPGKPAGSAEDVVLKPAGTNRDEFAFAFAGPDRLTQSTEFDVILTDDDGVTATRPVLLQLTEDQAPQVELAVDVLRKQGNAYLVTPSVRVPFLTDSKVRDDTGLSKVEFVLTYSQVESSFFLGVQAQFLFGVFAPIPVGGGWDSAFGPAANAALAARLVKADKKQTMAVPVGRFADALAALGADTPAVLAKKLLQPADPDAARVVKEVKFQNPQTDVFDLREAVPSLASNDAAGMQTRYRLELNVIATDANVETGPKTGQNLEPLRFLVVSEAELLSEISKDEENLIAKIDDALRKLREAQTKLQQTADRLAGTNPPPDAVLSAAVRAQDIGQDVNKAKDGTSAVLVEYRRLYREAEVNRCSETLLRRYSGEIIAPIQGILDGQFVDFETKHAAFATPLSEGRRPDDGAVSADKISLAELVRQMAAIREKLGEVLNQGKLRDLAVQLLNRQKQLGEVIARLQKDAIARIDSPTISPVPPVEIAKGETKVVKHKLEWGTFSGNEYKVKFEAGAGLKLPAEIRVPDDKNEVEYAVTAGPAAGTFVIKLVPSVGTPVDVTVVVK